MRLPFGLDLKTMLLTAVFIMFVWPFLSGWLSRPRGNSEA